jgi:DNA-binding XRE family transcriptional regulator
LREPEKQNANHRGRVVGATLRDCGASEMDIAAHFGANLAHCRKLAKLSQEELAVRAELHRTAVGQLERGERVARVDTLVKLAGSLGVPPGEVLKGIRWEPAKAPPPGKFQHQPDS